MFLSLDLFCVYRIELAVMELPCAGLTFPTKILCIGVSGFVAVCPSGVRYTCLLYVDPIFVKIILNNLVCKFDRMENNFLNQSIYVYIYIIITIIVIIIITIIIIIT